MEKAALLTEASLQGFSIRARCLPPKARCRHMAVTDDGNLTLRKPRRFQKLHPDPRKDSSYQLILTLISSTRGSS
jgi:hypothetical protein